MIVIISLLITENEDKKANEPIKTKRTLKRANTEAVTGGCGRESRQFMTKSSNNKDFISKDEARRRMMSWRKTTSLRYRSFFVRSTRLLTQNMTADCLVQFLCNIKLF